MTQEYSGSGSGSKPAKRPLKQLRKHSDKRRPKPRRYQSRNALTELIGAYRQYHPMESAAAAWTHFASVAGLGFTIAQHDPKTDTLAYVPRENAPERWIKRSSFIRQFERLQKISTE